MRHLLCPNEKNDDSKLSHCILEVDPVKLASWRNNGGIVSDGVADMFEGCRGRIF